MASLPMEALVIDKNPDEAESTSSDNDEFDKRDKLVVSCFFRYGMSAY